MEVSYPNPVYFLVREKKFNLVDDGLEMTRIIDAYELVTTRNPRTGRTYRRYRWVGERA